jgi:hypothetical protein
VVTLRLVVDGSDSVLPACQRHAEWLRVFSEEDADVRIVDRAPQATTADTSTTASADGLVQSEAGMGVAEDDLSEAAVE